MSLFTWKVLQARDSSPTVSSKQNENYGITNHYCITKSQKIVKEEKIQAQIMSMLLPRSKQEQEVYICVKFAFDKRLCMANVATLNVSVSVC